MTDREKAIVMAHTGVCMLTGDKFQIFHNYVEDILGRPVWTHDIGWLENEIKEKSKADFIALCADESSSENPNKWIPVSERLPKKDRYTDFYKCLVAVICTSRNNICDSVTAYFDGKNFYRNLYDRAFISEVKAWMPLPEPYKAEGSDKE